MGCLVGIQDGISVGHLMKDGENDGRVNGSLEVGFGVGCSAVGSMVGPFDGCDDGIKDGSVEEGSEVLNAGVEDSIDDVVIVGNRDEENDAS